MKVLERHEETNNHDKPGYLLVQQPWEPPLTPVLNLSARGPPGELSLGTGVLGHYISWPLPCLHKSTFPTAAISLPLKRSSHHDSPSSPSLPLKPSGP